MLTLISFVVTLSILIAVHEYGHYRVAIACGVKVLRFSIGFGKPVYSWRLKNKSTEFVIGMLPLGGYVKMLDEREGPVDPAEKHLAFNNQPLRSRAAVVAAGPAANLLLAVLLYTLVNWIGVQEPKAVLASPEVGSLAYKAGLVSGDVVGSAAFDGESFSAVLSFEDLRWRLTQGALNSQDLSLEVGNAHSASTRTVMLPLSKMDTPAADQQLLKKIGILGPWTQPVIGDVIQGGAADRSGLHAGDIVLKVGDIQIVDGQQLRDVIRKTTVEVANTVENILPKISPQSWTIVRDGQTLIVQVKPEFQRDGSTSVPRISAYVGAPPAFATVRYGPVDGVWHGVVRTWQVSALTLKMMGKMVTGDVSLKNLSGPLTIADYAGKSASLGFTAYLLFLALVSISLGVLNLLPVPVLDGGHLMYYLWEGLTGRGVSLVWMDRLQRGGVAVLFGMMSIALFNDVTRLLG